VPYGGVGHRLAGPCARLATWMHVPGNGGDRQGAALCQGGRRAAPAVYITRLALGRREGGKARLTDLQFVILKGPWRQFVQSSSAPPKRHGPL
jgi:hypothetical protein